MLKGLYADGSAFTLLEKLLKSNPFRESLLVIVFHLSHLLLRQLLYPDNEQSFIVFARLNSYQTEQLFHRCAHLMPFNDWLNFVDALSVSPQQQAICLLTLIKLKLDLAEPDEFLKAQKAV